MNKTSTHVKMVERASDIKDQEPTEFVEAIVF